MQLWMSSSVNIPNCSAAWHSELLSLLEEVIEINAEVLRMFGGLQGVRDSGALQSALGRLATGYHADPIEEA